MTKLSDLYERRKTDLWANLAVYATVNTVLVAVNLATTPDRIWFHWSLIVWGVALAAFYAFGVRPLGKQLAAKIVEKRRRLKKH